MNNMTTHKMSKTQFYTIWTGMNRRCKETKNPRYKDYGGRGIQQQWNSFEEFKKDMYESYKKHLKHHGKHNTSIDRINNEGHYCKLNCKWSTRREQYNNKRINKTQQEFIAYNLKTGQSEICNNQREFAKKHNLQNTHISGVLTGKVLTHKGWRFVPNTKENKRFLNCINQYGLIE